MSRSARTLILVSVAALATLGGAASSAQANFTKTLTYSCNYPLVGEQPLSVAIDAAIPSSVPVKTATNAFVLNAVATAGGDTSTALKLLKASTLEGVTRAKATVSAPGIVPVKVGVDIVVPKQHAAISGDVVLNASGSTPPLTFPKAGTATISVTSLALNLTARKADGTPIQLPPVGTDSDGDPNTFDVACVLDPIGQDTQLASIAVTDGTTTPTAGSPTPTPTAVTPTPTPITPTPTPVSPTPTPVTPTPSPINPVSVTLNYVCTFPALAPQPLALKITSDIPATIARNTATGAFDIQATAAVSAGASRGLSALGGVSVEGKAVASATLASPGSPNLPLKVPTTIAKTSLPSNGDAFSTSAVGSTPSLTFAKAGTATITVGGLVLTLSPRLSDGTLTGLDTFETECKQVPGQDNTLATIQVGGSTPTPSSVPTATPLASPTPTATPTPSPSPTPTPPSTVHYGYTLSGSAVIKTLAKGNVPLTGSLDTTVDMNSNALTGTLALDQTSANLIALGFLPVTAKIAFVQTAPTTGTLIAGILSSTSKMRIKIPQVTVLGVPIAGGSACQTTSVSTINLRSVGVFFNPVAGGVLAGTFSIGNLGGCGFLTGIVSPITAGGGNALTVKLAPKPLV